MTSDQKNITAGHGDLVTLPCQDPRHTDITSVEWIRPDLEPKYVFGVYRLWWFKKEEQNPSFKNRAKLKDGEMRDGDASLVLKDVGTEDTGTYMCHVRQRGAQSTMSIVHLTVGPGELLLLHPSVQMRTENITAEPGEKLDVVVGELVHVLSCHSLSRRSRATGLTSNIC